MRDDEIRSRLVAANPWWRAAALGDPPDAWTIHDRILRARDPFDLGFRTEVLADLATNAISDHLVVLRGPRRVGKSLALRDLAAAMCRRADVEPHQVISLSLDGMSARDLPRVESVGRELTRVVDPAPRVWLLDEVTSIDGWTSRVKHLRDATPFGDDTVVLTGSSYAATAMVERDLFAGRAGHQNLRRQRILLPMSFRSFAMMTGRPFSPIPVSHPADLQRPEMADVLRANAPFVDELDLAWQSYLACGGFPRSVGEWHRNGEVSDSFLLDIGSWLRHDVEPDAHEDSLPLLVAAIEARTGSPLNRSALAEALGYSGRSVFDRRLSRFVQAFGALWCPQVDEVGRVVPGAQQKLYLGDPVLAWLGHRLRSGVDPPDFTRLTEAALAVAIARSIDDLQPGRWIAGDTIGYLRSGNGNEIDFAPRSLPTPAGSASLTPIEAKWVSQGWKGASRGMHAKLGHGIVATKSVLDLNGPVWAVPAPLVALLLA